MVRMSKKIYRDRPNAVSGMAKGSRSSSFAWLVRTRVQLFGGLIFAVLLPLFLRLMTMDELGYVLPVELFQATAGTLLSFLVGFVLLRQLIVYPGTQAVSYILISFSIAYVICVLVFFFLRIDYSRFQFAASFVLSQIWFHAIYIFTERAIKPRLAVVRQGAVDNINKLTQMNCVWLEKPDFESLDADGIVADLRSDLSDDWERFLAQAALKGIPVYHVKQIVESLTGRVEIEALSENSLGSVLPSLLYARLKRSADFVSALLVLPVFAIVILFAAIVVKLNSKGSVFFVQERQGYGGHMFKMVKIRTMYEDDEKKDIQYSFTGDNDPRIVPMGHFLRKYRIDEFPQIWNIIKGDMSWIGPRPEPMDVAIKYEKEIPFYVYRHIVRPGITGWAQVNQGYAVEVEAATTKLQYDFYYIKHLSLWLDLLIVAKTIKTMLTGFGSR